MQILDLRSAIEALREWKGQLVETDIEVDPEAELSGVYRHVGAGGTVMRPTRIDGPAMIFNNVKGHPDAKVLIGLLANRERTAMLLGCKKEELGKLLCEAALHPIEPVVSTAKTPCQEIVHRAEDDDFDLFQLIPALTNTLVDAGPYITMGMCYATHPDTGLSDVTIHRMCIQSRDELSIFLQPGSKHIGAMAERATELGQPLPISISIGVDPAIEVGSCFEPPTTPLGYNELSIAGAIRKTPVVLTPCVSIKEHAIAHAEYVIEGEIQPGVKVVEDQNSHTGFAMPEFPGYNGAASHECWLIKVKAVTHRKHPIMQTVIGPSEEHVNLAGIPTEASILNMINGDTGWRLSDRRCVGYHRHVDRISCDRSHESHFREKDEAGETLVGEGEAYVVGSCDQKKLGAFELDVELSSDCKRIGILGASGCGKSMTLKCIAGIETPDQGRIIVDGQTLFDRGVNIKPQKRRIGYLFQNYALFPTMTVGANIAAGLKGTKDEKRQIVDRMIRQFRLEGLEDRLPGELSGGQQRVALARIMAYEPEIILLDEPFSALDAFLKDQLQQELKQLLEGYDGTVILVSHSRDEIYRFSKELVVMDAGRTVCHGKTKEIFADPQWKEAARLTGCKNIASAQRIDSHHVCIPAWGITLTLQREIPEDIRFVGFRAHEFLPVWKSSEEDPVLWNGTFPKGIAENRIPVKVDSVAELPFERKYFLQSREGSEKICWFVQRDQWQILEKMGLPEYLEIPEEKLLLLR